MERIIFNLPVTIFVYLKKFLTLNGNPSEKENTEFLQIMPYIQIVACWTGISLPGMGIAKVGTRCGEQAAGLKGPAHFVLLCPTLDYI